MKFGTSIRKILSVDSEHWRVVLEYTDGFRGTVDLSHIFGRSRGKSMVSEILRGGMFDRCFIESGALAWPNGYELCPDALRAKATPKRARRAALATARRARGAIEAGDI